MCDNRLSIRPPAHVYARTDQNERPDEHENEWTAQLDYL